MRYRKVAAPDETVDLPITDPGWVARVSLWVTEDGKYHVGIEFGDGTKVVLLEFRSGEDRADAEQIAGTLRGWIRRIRVVDEYGASF